MTEQELQREFTEFLKNEKGYSDNSFLFGAPIFAKSSDGTVRRYVTDLLILDTQHNNYLALIEFKTIADNNRLRALRERVNIYLNTLKKPELPAYIVTSQEKGFTIYLSSKNDLIELEKENFPRYETIQSKAEADSKTTSDDIYEIKVHEAKSKKELVRSFAWSTLTSLVIGMLVVGIFSKELFKNGIFYKPITSSCCDTTKIMINELTNKLSKLEKELSSIKNVDTSHKINLQDKKLIEIEKRLAIFEAAVTASPDRLLKLEEIKFEFKELQNSISKEKEISEIKVANLKEKLDQVMIWTSGLIITIIGSIVGFAINAFRKS